MDIVFIITRARRFYRNVLYDQTIVVEFQGKNKPVHTLYSMHALTHTINVHVLFMSGELQELYCFNMKITFVTFIKSMHLYFVISDKKNLKNAYKNRITNFKSWQLTKH